MQLPEGRLVLTSLAVLVCAIIVGALTAYARLADKNTPFDTGLFHGRVGAAGALLLFASVIMGNEPGQTMKVALGLLALTLMGGVTLYFLIRRKGVLPKSIILMHGAFAVAAVYILVFGLSF